MMGLIHMLLSMALSTAMDVRRCQQIHPRITQEQAIKLTMRPQGCFDQWHRRP